MFFIYIYFYRSPALEVYLIIRNIILSLWYSDCTQSVTINRCMDMLRLRGVVRVWCSQQLPRILHYMSRKGFVNHGLLINNTSLSCIQPIENKVFITNYYQFYN